MDKITALHPLPAGSAAADLPMHLAALTRIATQAARQAAAQAAASAARDTSAHPPLSARGDDDPTDAPRRLS